MIAFSIALAFGIWFVWNHGSMEDTIDDMGGIG